MNNFIRMIAALCLCVTLCGLLSACAGDVTPPTDTTPATTTTDTPTPADTTAPDDGKLHIIESGKVKYDLIYPILADDAMRESVKRMTDAFRELTGLRLRAFDDYVDAGKTRDSETYEILLGKTGYDESAQGFSGVRYNDYRVCVVGHKIIVAAHKTETLNAAIDWLLEQLRAGLVGQGESAVLTLDSLDHAVKSEGYEVGCFTLGGNSLENYRMVYGDANMLEPLQALRDELAERTGYVLDIVKDTEPATEYEIIFGETARPESANAPKQDYLHYSVEFVGSKLVLSAGGLHSLSKVAKTLASLLIGDKTEVALSSDFRLEGSYIDDPYNNTTMPEGADVRVMSCNILAEYENYNGRIPVALRKEVFFAALDYYQPTVVGLQEFSPAWFECFGEYRDADKYEVFKVMSPNGKDNYFTTILYRRDLLEVIDSGVHKYSVGNNLRGRCVAWASFRVKATGKVFSFTSTHLDGFDSADTEIQIAEWAEIINRLAALGPVMSTGDFNTTEGTQDFEEMQTLASVRDVRYDCEVRLNEEGSYHDLGNPMSGYGLALDHVFATYDAICKRFEMLIFNEQIWGSDHSWVLADMKLG